MSKSLLDASGSPLAKALADVLERASSPKNEVKKADSKPKQVFAMLDPNNTLPLLEKEEENVTLKKSILNLLNGGSKNSITRLAFEIDPTEHTQSEGIYQRKTVLLPDDILKRIAIQDNLVAAIVMTRSNHVASFGRKRPDRFSTGFVIEPMAGYKEKMSEEQKAEFDKQIRHAERKLTTCGSVEYFGSEERYMTFSQYLSMSVRNALTVGRIATEIIWKLDTTGEKKFHAFRPIDSGTIYRCINDGSQAEDVRKNARLLLEQVRKDKFKEEKHLPDQFDWVQVIKGKPVQVFTDKECAVHNFYPVDDVELNGYPVTPLDTVMNAVTTHLNIEEHNKLFFQSGRAAKGMLLIQSDDINEGVVQNIRQQFQASINSVQNSFRTPIFGLGKEDVITWQSIDNAGRDMEFQYLSDSNARVIMSAFQISPEELPGYGHLSRGTNSQALSEANNEYKLEAGRDVGIRPLLSQFEDFINARIFPLIDPQLAQICTVKFLGLDAESADKEAVRLQQDMNLHYTYDQALGQVEKPALGIKFGGEYPLNPQMQQIMEKFLTKGYILENFFGVKEASKNPRWDYCIGDPIDSQIFAAKQQVKIQTEAQNQQMQQQAQAQQQQSQQEQAQQPQGDLGNTVDQAVDVLSKSDGDGFNLPPSRRKLFAMQKQILKDTVAHWEAESKETISDIVKEVTKLKS